MFLLQAVDQFPLHTAGQAGRFLDLAVLHQILQNFLQIADLAR